MASSYNRKSSSSASSSPKPTFRRAKGQARPARPAPRPASSAPKPAPRRVASYSAMPRRGTVSRPAAPAPRSRAQAPGRVSAKRAFSSVAAKPRAKRAAAPRGIRVGAPLKALGGLLAPIGALVGAAAGHISGRGRRALLGGALAVAALAAVLLVVANIGLFSITDVRYRAGEHVGEAELAALVQVPRGSSLLNVDTAAIEEQLRDGSPWIAGADVERVFPHTLVITPRERTVAAIAYIPSGDIAWAVSSDGTWIAPVSLNVSVDDKGDVVEDGASGAREVTGTDAALALARQAGGVLFTDLPTDVSPVSGTAVDSEEVEAGLAYVDGFSAEFLKTVKDLSIPSLEAISANLDSGVEVSLGEPESIKRKEQIVTKLLEQQDGVTYINVRTPDAYTFRAVDTPS